MQKWLEKSRELRDKKLYSWFEDDNVFIDDYDHQITREYDDITDNWYEGLEHVYKVFIFKFRLFGIFFHFLFVHKLTPHIFITNLKIEIFYLQSFLK